MDEPFGDLERWDQFNTGSLDSLGSIFEDGRSMLFASDHPGGAGRNDIYLATRPGPGEAFDYRLELQTPFFYDPNEGNLVVDLTIAGYSPSLGDDIERTAQ